MQVMQRRFGKFLPRTADDTQVATVIAEFHEADTLLERLIESTKAWQQAWTDLLHRQAAIVATLDTIYLPITVSEASIDPTRYASTPRGTQQRITALRDSYLALKDDMIQEAQQMQTRIIVPAKEARRLIDPYKKVIKKRDDRKLDYERYRSRTEHVESQANRSERHDTALARHRINLEASVGEYETADQLVKSSLPQVTQLAFDLLPRLLNSQVMIQTTLLAHQYTCLHNFAQDFSIPSPAPATALIIATFEDQFTSLRLEIEATFKVLTEGKATSLPMTSGSANDASFTQLAPTQSGIRRGSGQTASSGRFHAPTSDYISTSSQAANSPYDLPVRPPRPGGPPQINVSNKPTFGMLAPDINTNGRTFFSRTPSPASSSHREARQQDYFATSPTFLANKPRQQSTGSVATLASNFSSAGVVAGMNNPVTTNKFGNPLAPSISTTSASSSIAAAKKKPPPPPPPKRGASYVLQDTVIALYDFHGQNPGDLAFREGDRIRVIKRTESDNDWWQGELRGLKGSFPANYCRTA